MNEENKARLPHDETYEKMKRKWLCPGVSFADMVNKEKIPCEEATSTRDKMKNHEKNSYEVIITEERNKSK